MVPASFTTNKESSFKRKRTSAMLVAVYPTLQQCCSHCEHFLLGKLERNWKLVTLKENTME